MKKLTKVLLKSIALCSILSMLALTSCSDGSSSSDGNNTNGSGSESGAQGAGGTGGAGDEHGHGGEHGGEHGNEGNGITYIYNAEISATASAPMGGMGTAYCYLNSTGGTITIMSIGGRVMITYAPEKSVALNVNSSMASTFEPNKTYTYTSEDGKVFELTTGATLESQISIREIQNGSQGQGQGQGNPSSFSYISAKSLETRYYTYSANDTTYVVICDNNAVYLTDGKNATKLKVNNAPAANFEPSKEYSGTWGSAATVTVTTGASLTNSATVSVSGSVSEYIWPAAFTETAAIFINGSQGVRYVGSDTSADISEIYVVWDGTLGRHYNICVNTTDGKSLAGGDGSIMKLSTTETYSIGKYEFESQYTKSNGKVYKFEYNNKVYYLVNSFESTSSEHGNSTHRVAFFSATDL
ncbi:hypothetical protein [Treponema sp.]|uniref:hypothetical protein n=1 Tax=Treponema sp. TaxID=166 RepID=UPI00298DF716|nr:hypothetical protein [Treponema sp.]MCQ2241070.1 hypothetical protein [Treponema sp.]